MGLDPPLWAGVCAATGAVSFCLFAAWSLLNKDYGTAAVLSALGVTAGVIGLVLAWLHEVAS